MHKLFDTLSSIGLAYDVVGVSILAWGVFWARDVEMRLQSQSAWDISLTVYRALFQQRRDVRFGLALAIIGFALQWLGQWYSTSMPYWISTVAWACLLIATTLYFVTRTGGLDVATKQALEAVERDKQQKS